MPRWPEILLTLVLFAAAPAAYAEPVSREESGKAQVQMQLRAQAAATSYARSISLDDSWVGYCWTEAGRKAEHADDGSIPFGVRWLTIDRAMLGVAVRSMEAWLTHEMTLCLARAKGDLARASEAAAKR